MQLQVKNKYAWPRFEKLTCLSLAVDPEIDNVAPLVSALDGCPRLLHFMFSGRNHPNYNVLPIIVAKEPNLFELHLQLLV